MGACTYIPSRGCRMQPEAGPDLVEGSNRSEASGIGQHGYAEVRVVDACECARAFIMGAAVCGSGMACCTEAFTLCSDLLARQIWVGASQQQASFSEVDCGLGVPRPGSSCPTASRFPPGLGRVAGQSIHPASRPETRGGNMSTESKFPLGNKRLGSGFPRKSAAKEAGNPWVLLEKCCPAPFFSPLGKSVLLCYCRSNGTLPIITQ